MKVRDECGVIGVYAPDAGSLAVLGLLGPLLWSWRGGRSGKTLPRGAGGPRQPQASRTGMSRDAAFAVLGKGR